jgi:hypothetical protein
MPEGGDDEARRDNRAAIRGPHEIAPATSWGRFLGGFSGQRARTQLGEARRANGQRTCLAGH